MQVCYEYTDSNALYELVCDVVTWFCIEAGDVAECQSVFAGRAFA